MPQATSALPENGLILPHPHDRCRIVGLFLRELRERRFRLQTGFAAHITTRLRTLSPNYRGKIEQSNISRVEGIKELAKRTVCEGKLLPRQDLLRHTLVGLELDTSITSLLLAFVEGPAFKPLSRREIENHLGRLPRAGELRTSLQQGDDHVRVHFMVMNLLKHAFSEKLLYKKHIKEVTMHHSSEAQDPSTLARIIFSYERRPGQFMRLTKYPAFTILDDESIPFFVPESARADHAKVDAVRGVFISRRRLFYRRLLLFGERNIHSDPALRRYARRESGHHLPVSRRRRHLFNLFRLLKSYPTLFRVGLVPEEVETELLINCTRWVLLRATSYHHVFREDSYHAGPNFIYWSDAGSVMRTQLEFEDCWERLSAQGLTEPDKVSEQIAELLREACRVEPEDGDRELLSALDDPNALRLNLTEADCVSEGFFCKQLKEQDRAVKRSAKWRPRKGKRMGR